MEFSFNGSLSELKEFAQVICGSGIRELPEVCVAETASIAETVPDKTQDVEGDTATLIADKPWIDPATGTYFTAFSDMMDACDALIRNSQQGDVGALLKANSANGEYCGVPPKAWISVTKNAKELLKKSGPKKSEPKKEQAHEDPKAIFERVKSSAMAYVKADKDNHNPKLRELLHKHGLVKLSDLTKKGVKEHEDFEKDLNTLIGGAE